MAAHRILITGSTGFVGARVTARLTASDHTPRPQLRLLAHRSRPEPPGTDQIEVHHGSLSDPESLHGLCEGVTTVLHLASHISGDPRQCRAVNDTGTAALLAEAERCGVRRVIQLGTTAVYRDGRHLNAMEGALPLGPSSPTSVTRLAGEQRVLKAGGLVLRPHLIHGRGDVWVVPALARFMTTLPHWVDGGRALISLISADDLAHVVATLALRPHLPQGEVLHVARPRPVSGRELFTTAARALRLPLPTGEVTHAQASTWPGGHTDAGWQRRLSLLTVDHWYDTSRLWRLLGTPAPHTGFTEEFAAGASWYRSHLAAQYPGARARPAPAGA
ncbi:NAD-dependent epimerase/dehydratase family protein [Streptomyces tagetis]|uniref:NAD(P)-dependent oxidoreductase n=1 Tax=Streptomyces tagetis TaxID=2820809 RepID=A0A940XFH1_9ACTN|nr:NAD(P)-dependent oxidoreductase [Streptomyces sp. RG38]MBQ0826507.1 NAD(P)-dependent oxidoreductase [Streptomyces sp. RG38]